MRSEKITINLSSVELAQVDYLVEKGLYASRADFIRLAIRKQTEEHKKEIDQFMEPTLWEREAEEDNSGLVVIALGGTHISKEDVQRLLRVGKKAYIRLIGVLTVDKEITLEEIKEVTSVCKVFGKIVAEPEVKAFLQGKSK